MKAEWFARVDGQEYGPYTWQQMLQMAAEGRVPADLPVRRSIDSKWFLAKQVPGLVAGGSAAAAGASPPAARSPKDDSSHLKRAKPLSSSAGSTAATKSGPVPVPPPPPPPRATATPPAPASQWPVIVTDTPSSRGKVKASASAASAVESGAHKLPEKRSPLLLVGMLAGLAALVLVAGGIGMWAVWFRAAGAPEAAQIAGPLSPETSGAKRSTTAITRTAASGTAERDEQQGPTSSDLAAQKKLVSSIASWQSTAGVRSFGVSNASLQLARVWRTRAESDDKKDQEKQYVCVEVTISNKSSAPLRYKGWNAYNENGAILADESGKVLPLVPVEKTPELSRLKQASVPGGGSVREVLVFAAPASDDEVLHLVLPYSVFYSNVRPPHRALELTPDLMGMDLASAAQQSEAGAGSPQPPAESSVELDPVPASAPAADKPDAKPAAKGKEPDKPPSLRDMINNDRGTPAKPDDMPEKGDKEEKPADQKGDKKGKDEPKKPENPFEPKGDNPLDPLSVVPKGEDSDKEP